MKCHQILELSEKDFKAAITKMLQGAIMNMIKANEKIESLSKEIESINKKIRRTK